MRKIFCLLVLLLPLAAPVSAQIPTEEEGLRTLDEKNGFRNHRFGETLSDFTGLVDDGTIGEEHYYHISGDYLKIGTADLEKIVYEFYRGHFGYLMLQSKGTENNRIVLQTLVTLYGEGVRSDTGQENYIWRGKLVNLVYQEDTATKVARVRFYSLPLEVEQGIAERAAARKATSDL